jgi:hypothetical protein
MHADTLKKDWALIKKKVEQLTLKK